MLWELKFFDDLYVIAKGDVPFDCVEYPLAFMTPYGSDPASSKRITTANGWALNRYWTGTGAGTNTPTNHRIITNDPMIGFKISDVSTRYSTDNKVYRVQDPRGFTLEISAANLLHVLENNVVDHCEIMSEMVWARRNQSHFLISKDSDEYRASLNMNTGPLIYGAKVIVKDLLGYYLGKTKVQTFEIPYNRSSGYRWSYRKKDKPSHVFLVENFNQNTKEKTWDGLLLQTDVKKVRILEDNPTDFPAFDPDQLYEEARNYRVLASISSNDIRNLPKEKIEERIKLFF